MPECCPWCREEVSSKTTTCPHCGKDVREEWLRRDVKKLEGAIKGCRAENALLRKTRDALLAASDNLENDDGSIPDHAWMPLQAAIDKAKNSTDPLDTPAATGKIEVDA